MQWFQLDVGRIVGEAKTGQVFTSLSAVARSTLDILILIHIMTTMMLMSLKTMQVALMTMGMMTLLNYWNWTLKRSLS